MITTPTEKVMVSQRESILVSCGSYFSEVFHKDATSNVEVYAIHLFPDILKEVFKDDRPLFLKGNRVSGYTRKIPQKNVFDHFIQSLNFYFENPSVVKKEILYLKIKELVLLLLQTDAAASILDLYNQMLIPQKASISEVIEAHLCANLTIGQLSALAGLSLSTFKREFKRHFKDTPANYIRNKRMAKAAELLTYSSDTIREISFVLGYEHPSYFSKVFRQKFQVLPSEYRKLHKK